MEAIARQRAEQLAPWWSARIGRAVQIDHAERIPGGASRETWRLSVRSPSGSIGPVNSAHPVDDAHPSDPPEDRLGNGDFILRLDPGASLIETERALEFGALQAFHGTEVPVPEPLWLEPDASVMGGPFFLMRAVAGGVAAPLRLMQPPYAAHHARMAERKWSVLGAIARADAPLSGEFGQVLAGDPADDRPFWLRELETWQAMLEADALEPQPIQQAAIRWMVRNPPAAPQRVSVVHGDYRTGNLLFGEHGELLAVLDWEMVHRGDPLEDLAWGLNRVWCFQNDARCGGLLERAGAIALWERASGLRADAQALHWWEVFSCLKGQAIWCSAAREYQEGRVSDTIMVTAAWMMINAQDRATLELLGKL